MAENVGNKWSALLNGAIDSDDTSLAYDGAVGTLPSVNFRIVVQDAEDDDTNREIMLVTAGTASPLTVTRGAESTTAVSHGDNSYVVHILTAGGLQAFVDQRGFTTPASGAGAYGSADVAISTSGEAAIAMNSEAHDSDGYHSTSSNTSRLTVPSGFDGLFSWVVNLRYSANVTGYFVVRKNGSTILGYIPKYWDSASSFGMASGSGAVQLVAGDYIEVMGTAGSAANVVATNGSLPWFSISREQGGGGITRSQLGTTSIGASFDSTAKTVYKKIIVSRDGLLASISVAGKGQSSAGFTLDVFVMSDNAGTPLNVIAASQPTRTYLASAGTAHTHNLQSSVGVINATARFITTPIGLWVTAGTYWIGVAWNGNAANDWQIAYSSGTGSDRTKASTDGPYDHSAGASSTGTNDFSMYADLLTAGGPVLTAFSFTGMPLAVIPVGLGEMPGGQTASTAGQARACPIIIPGPMRVRSLWIDISSNGSGTIEWGLFNYASDETSCIKLAGGSAAPGGTGFREIAATGAPVEISGGAYMLIVKNPDANASTLHLTPSRASAGIFKSQNSYTWDDTPTLATGWSDAAAFTSCYLEGDIDASNTRW